MLPYITSRLAVHGIDSLAIEHAHAAGVADLPPHHHDPFDRLLIAQAVAEAVPTLTADPRFRDYDVDVVW